MRIAFAFDHRGRKGADCVKTAIELQGHEYVDLGPKEEGAVDCPDSAYVAAMAVVQKEADMAILLCTTGAVQISYEAWLTRRNVDTSKTFFLATGIIMFDFELFIGGLVRKGKGCQLSQVTSPLSPCCPTNDYGLSARLTVIFEYDLVDRLQCPFELYRKLPKILFEVHTIFYFSYTTHT